MMDMVNERRRPAWKGIDQKTYQTLVDFYKQDFECFGYEPDFEKDVLPQLKRLESVWT